MVASSSPKFGIMVEWEGWMVTFVCILEQIIQNNKATPAMISGREDILKVMYVPPQVPGQEKTSQVSLNACDS